MAHEGDSTSRRAFLGAAVATAAGATLLRSEVAQAAKDASVVNLAAAPPPGFTPFTAPGKIVKVSKSGSLQANKVYPEPNAAKDMLAKALTEFTGEPDMPKAIGRFIHKDDKVCVKVNGIAMRNHATSKELVLPFLEALIASGVPAERITVLEQYGSYLQGTRINEKNVPAGVKISIHANGDATMPERLIPGTGVRTKFCRALTESTAVVNFSLIKDHSICGYTGCLKNVTHGSTINPHDFHQHNASPQIAALYAQDVMKSRVRLHITDGFKLIYDGGPLDKNPDRRVGHGSVYVTTDPVAMDTIGWNEVEKWRADKKLPTLTKAGREPSYIRIAGELGLGVADKEQIRMREVTL